MSKKAGLRVPDNLAAWVEERGERAMSPQPLGPRLMTEVGLWRATLASCLARQTWTLGEIGLIADVMNGTVISDTVAGSLGLVAQEVIAATRNARRFGDLSSFGAKWNVDEEALIDRLVALDPCTDQALADAISRWWATTGEHTVDGWTTVGVQVREEAN